LEGDEEEQWRITVSALGDGRRLFPPSGYKGHFGAYAVNLFVLDQLRSDCPMHPVPLGSGGTGCVMNVTYHDQPLYIKLTIEDDIAVILSFHVSKHPKGS
jgi:hypothetical protein